LNSVDCSQCFEHACVRACAGSTKYSLTHTKVSCRPPAAIAFSTRWTAYCLTSRLKTTNSGVSGIRRGIWPIVWHRMSKVVPLPKSLSFLLAYETLRPTLRPTRSPIRFRCTFSFFFFLPTRRKNRAGIITSAVYFGMLFYTRKNVC